MSDQSTTLAERYVLEERIAAGGMASVWRARDSVLARPVAVKILHPHLAQDASFVERFRIEALAAARLSHPNVVAIYDTGNENSTGDGASHFIVMEHCGGGTIGELLAREGALDPERVASIGSTICEALAYAHRHEVIHRDVKPANVLVSDHGALKVTDFGIAKAAFASKDITTTGSIIGTVTYISPEQANGIEPDARSDIYALGVVLYELAVGKPPFREESDVATALKHIHEMPPAPRTQRAGIPRDLDAVVMKALAKDPSDRFQSADEMRAALGGGSFSAGSTQVLRTPRTPSATEKRPTAAQPGGSSLGGEAKRFIPVLLLIVGAIVAAVLIASLMGSDEEPSNGAGGSTDNPGGAPVVKIVAADDFDPGGSPPEEHTEDVPAAHDGNKGSFWTTETYNSPITALKDGVGLLFDLGESTSIAEVEITFDKAGYAFEVRAGDSEEPDQNAYETVASIDSSGATETVEVDGTEGRYWLIWITGLPGGGGGQGAIGEVRFLGS